MSDSDNEYEVLTDETARIDMICRDTIGGGFVVIDRMIDHRQCEIADYEPSTGSAFFQGDRQRYDELVFTGDYYTPRKAIISPAPVNAPATITRFA